MERSKSSPQRPDYLSEDTIAAPASPAGGAVGLVRISGPESLHILSRLSGGASVRIEPRQLFRVLLRRQDGSSLDDAMAVWFKGPASFTGEDVVELFLHGSAFVLSDVLQEIQRLGARPALPGEFSFRAVRNGKMDLNQAQAVADLVAAGNRGAVELALEKLQGAQSRLVREMAEELRTLATLSELGIDFADQDVEEVSLPRLKERAQAVMESLSRLEGSFERGLRIQEGISVSFIGKPNAGKSSFFNALLGEDRSIVTEIAGTTRDIVRERINLQGQRSSITLRVEDTAGIRTNAADQVEEIGIERSLESARRADLVLLILDGKALIAHPEQERSDVLSLWKSIGAPQAKTLGILTRADQMTEQEQKSACDWVSKTLGIPCHSVSSMTHQNLPETVQAVVTFCERLVIRDPGEVLLTRMEQVESVRAASARLSASLDTGEESLFSSDVRHALEALSPVIGATPTDDLLGRIFSQFCIGK